MHSSRRNNPALANHHQGKTKQAAENQWIAFPHRTGREKKKENLLSTKRGEKKNRAILQADRTYETIKQARRFHRG
jgi:hypothetical protein